VLKAPNCRSTLRVEKVEKVENVEKLEKLEKVEKVSRSILGVFSTNS
jgi:hypothetical protein